jgi:hypothetical protein|tara:strand:+ start:233 stop:466 length:234 start_codon:yes stop_codon:yes gene_type:complete
MKDKLKTLKHQINKYIKDLEELSPKAIDAGDQVDLGIMRGEQTALEWVLERIKENADGQKRSAKTSRSTQEAMPTGD